MNLSPNYLTFDAMYSAYSTVLQSQPGKALRLPDGGAVFLEDGEVYAVTLNEAGEVEMETAGCISPVAWDDDRGCWDCDESAEVCASAVNFPVFVSLPA